VPVRDLHAGRVGRPKLGGRAVGGCGDCASLFTIVGVVIDYSDGAPGAASRLRLSGPDLTLAQRLRRADGIRRGPGETQVAMTEPSVVRVTRPLAADPREFCARMAALGCF
jgi:hypothetical protein